MAKENGVKIDYRVGQLPELNFKKSEFDVIGLTYAHFPPDIRRTYHRLLSTYLSEGGIIIIEAFCKQHLPYREENPAIGGPRNLESLFSIEELTKDFEGLEIIEAEEKEVELHEGLYHNGKGFVVRMIAKKH